MRAACPMVPHRRGRQSFRRSEIPTCHPERHGTHNKSDILLVSSTFADPRLPSSKPAAQARESASHCRSPSLALRAWMGKIPSLARRAFMIPESSVRGCPCPESRRMLTSAGRMPKRSQHPSERRPWMAVANVRRRGMGSPELRPEHSHRTTSDYDALTGSAVHCVPSRTTRW